MERMERNLSRNDDRRRGRWDRHDLPARPAAWPRRRRTDLSIGEVDPRLPVQAQVLGVVTPAGQAIAFPVDQAQTALAAGKIVELGGVRLVSDGGGLRAENADGSSVTSHQSFWFAWSQFQPDTLVWTPLS